MAGEAVKVEVRGIRELSAAFRRVDPEIQRELKVKLTAVAQHVVGVAQGKMPHRSGRAAGSVKARGRASGASIAFGGTAAPYEPWLDFGGSTGRGHHAGGGGSITRPFDTDGRYVYPAIEESKSETARAIEDAVVAAARRAGFEVR